MLSSLTKRFWTLRNKMIVLALMPLMVLTIFLGYSFTQSRLNQIDYSIEINAKSMSNELSYVSTYAISKGDDGALHYIAYEMLTYPYITGVAVYDMSARPIITLGSYPILRTSMLKNLSTQQDIEHKIYMRETTNTIEVMMPIFTVGYLENNNNISRDIYDPSDILGWAVISVNKFHIDQIRENIVKQSLMLAFIALFMTFLIAIKLANELLSPLTSLIDKVRKIRRGNLDVSFDKRADHEFGVLNEVIENMVMGLRDANEHMKLRVEEATQALQVRNQELLAARNKAEQATRVKSQFLANMSHEIRTPLNAVIGFMDLLEQSSLSSVQREYVQTVQHSSQQLLTIVSDILDVSKIEAGSLMIHPHRYDVIASIQQTLSQFKPLALQKRLPIFFDHQGFEALEIEADSMRITQILTNLVANALKFTHHGMIVVKLNYHDGQLYLSVQDSGIGISNEQQEKLFKPFSQADGSTSRQYGGTGLGLSISKRLAELMGGDIRLESAVNQGSTFSLSLPAICHDEKTAVILDAQVVIYISSEINGLDVIQSMFARYSHQVVIIHSAMKLIDYVITHEEIEQVIIFALDYPDTNLVSEIRAFSSTQIIGVNFSHQSANYLGVNYPFWVGKLAQATLPNKSLDNSTLQVLNPTRTLHALIVDDNEINIKLLCILCQDMGLRVESAHYAHKALDLMRTTAFDVILTDLHMPVMDGIEFYQAIRQMHGYQDIPVIVTTADCSQEMHRELMELGFYAVAIKPIQRTVIQALLSELGLVEEVSVTSHTQVHSTEVTQWIDTQRAAVELGTKVAMVTDMLNTLMTTLPHELKNIEMYYQAEDAIALEKALHKLKGGLIYCGLYPLKRTTEALQNSLKTAQWDEIKIAYQGFLDAVEQTINSYQQGKYHVDKT